MESEAYQYEEAPQNLNYIKADTTGIKFEVKKKKLVVFVT